MASLERIVKGNVTTYKYQGNQESFTWHGGTAEEYIDRAKWTMIALNVPEPVRITELRALRKAFKT